MDQKIQGGFYIKARKTQESWIAHAPPHVREIWDWILMNANWKDHGTNSASSPRGSLMTSYNEIIEGLHWRVGWRKEKYSRWDCEKAMKALTKATMIATKKTTRGLIITILNYEKYQDPENYESHNETYRKATRKPQTRHTIRKEGEEREEGNTYVSSKEEDTLSGSNGTRPIPYQEIISFLNQTCNTQFKPDTPITRNLIKARFNQGFKVDDFKLVIQTKASQWMTEPKMVQYLRPQTLFGTKFEAYLTEATRKPVTKETMVQRKQREWEEAHGKSSTVN